MPYLTCEQVAELAKCSVYQVREAVKSGALKAFKPGKKFVFDSVDVDNWIKGCAVVTRNNRSKTGG